MRIPIAPTLLLLGAWYLVCSCEGAEPGDFLHVEGKGFVGFKVEVPPLPPEGKPLVVGYRDFDEYRGEYGYVFYGYSRVSSQAIFPLPPGSWGDEIENEKKKCQSMVDGQCLINAQTPFVCKLVVDRSKGESVSLPPYDGGRPVKRRYRIGSDGRVAAVEMADPPVSSDGEYLLKLTMYFERDALDIRSGFIEPEIVKVTSFENCRIAITMEGEEYCRGFFQSRHTPDLYRMYGDFDCTTLDFDPDRANPEHLTGAFHYDQHAALCGDF